jgi:hypothetical protein
MRMLLMRLRHLNGAEDESWGTRLGVRMKIWSKEVSLKVWSSLRGQTGERCGKC